LFTLRSKYIPHALLLSLSANSFATNYGVYDARAVAMAGTAVAVGNVNQAHNYNPSLIAFHKGHEDRTQDGRHTLGFVVGRASDGAATALDAIRDDLEGRLNRAVEAMDNAPTPETANIAIAAARDLDAAMRDLQDQDIDADLYAGYAVTVPADGEGGAFFIGSRIVGSGAADIQEADFDLLQDYIEALQFVASAGAEGEQHPELYNPEGEFYSPTSRIQSAASGTGIALTEIGISGAKQWPLWGVPVAFGIAPKLVQLSAYGDSWQVVDDEFDSSDLDKLSYYFNLDIGVTALFKDRFRVGLAVKDAREREFVTADGRTITLKPRARLGLAYVHPKVRVGLDYDLEENQNLHTLIPEQVVSAGIEYEPIKHLNLRLGYQHDLAELGDDRTGFGVGWQFGWFAAEASYSVGELGDGGAIQFSIYQ
jgi:F plasmid transfer operon, TraF, protein